MRNLQNAAGKGTTTFGHISQLELHSIGDGNGNGGPPGLTRLEAETRLRQYGPNAVQEPKPHLFFAIAPKFWAPVPWMLEATIILELILGKRAEAIIIGCLLIFNAGLALLQERRAQNALALLRKRLPVTARVKRDGQWQLVPAEDLVPGDFIHVRLGDVMPADVRLIDGEIQLDQSTLTGESLPLDAERNRNAFAGSVVTHGEASGEVIATGARTYFGKTAELVRAAKTVSHLQTTIFAIIKYLVMLDGALALVLLLYCWLAHLPMSEMLPFILMLLVASVPVALPATFTVATALGSMELADSGVLVTRLSAIEEAAAMQVLCSDKTGTITQNRLAVARLQPFAPYREMDLLRFALLASDPATEDPIDAAILTAANGHDAYETGWRKLELIPFDPSTKLSEAIITQGAEPWRVIKGAPDAVSRRVKTANDYSAPGERLAAQGYRVLGVGVGPENDMRFVGLLALEDPPREDSKQLVQKLRDLGVRVMMITGDALPTARAVSCLVGIGNRAVQPKALEKEAVSEVLQSDVFAGVYPEDKFHLVQILQRAGMVAGMTGDGVNDAPALKQAEVGIAVANATDVAKAAASLVLTNPGLTDIVAAVKASRRIYQRMLTYTLNKIIKTIEIALLLSVGVILTRSFIITPLLIVVLLFTNDFVTMSIATDNVSYSAKPDRWHIRSLVLTGLAMGSMVLVLSFGVLLAARDWLQLPLPELQTVIFITLVFTGQGTLYLVRERRHFWKSKPSKWLILSSLADIVVVGVLATHGILMASIPLRVLFGVLITCSCYLASIDVVKPGLLGRLSPM